MTLNRRVTVQVQLSEFTVHPHTIFTMTEGKLFVVGKRKNRIKEEKKRWLSSLLQGVQPEATCGLIRTPQSD